MRSDSEFDLIARYFDRPAPGAVLGIGDDCALLSLSLGRNLAVSTDMLVEGRHFLSDMDPRAVGHKALAVNLSDLAAMGARPLACTLALSLPGVDHAWLQGFSEGFHALSRRHRCPLVGGDTTRSNGGVVVSVTVMGEVRRAHALRRDAARVGDDVWLTGALGAADVALRLLQGRLPPDERRLRETRVALELPQPRLAFGCYLAGVARSAIDISDGLLQDLGHILDASRCGAELWWDAMPVDAALGGLDRDVCRDAVLAGGDAYELCFTASPRRREQILAIGTQLDVPVTRIGAIVRDPGLSVLDKAGHDILPEHTGFDHFLDS